MRFNFLNSVFLGVAVLATGLSAQAGTFRYREFVPSSQDCKAELSNLKTRFEKQTGAKVIDSNCAAVSIPGADDQDNFDANAATLIYTASHEMRAHSVQFGRGSGYGAVGFAGDISGAYDSQADCQADLQHQIDLFKQETKAEPVAAYCVAPAMAGTRFNLQIDSFQPLAKHLYMFEAFRDEASAASRTHAQNIVAAQGVTVARSFNDWVFFYDTGSSEQPTHMKVRSADAGLFNEGADCTTQQPVLSQILQNAGLSNFEVACTGMIGTSSLEVVSSQAAHLFFSNTGVGGYASLQECNADSARQVSEARRRGGRGFLGGYCVYVDPLDTLRGYGLETVYTNR